MTRHPGALAMLLTLIALDGCAASSPASAPVPLGRSLSAAPSRASTGLPLAGESPTEQHGTIPPGAALRQNTPSELGATPQAALARYAQRYITWQADSLPTVERQLVALAVGAARLTAEQIAASHSTTAQLIADHVQNTGTVLSIAPGQGPARNQWIIVTQEHTTGTGPYAGLPPTLRVTLARTQHLNRGWAVSDWTPSG